MQEICATNIAVVKCLHNEHKITEIEFKSSNVEAEFAWKARIIIARLGQS